MPESVPFIDLKRHEPGFVESVSEKFSHMLKNTQFVGGQEVASLEEKLSNYVGVDHTVSCANGTDALQLSLRAVGIGAGDVVLVPNMTFWATFEAAVNVGATPVTVDSDISDGGISYHDLESALKTIRPKAAIIAHLYGWGSACLDDIRAICKREGVVLVEDGAQCFGTRFNSAPIYAGATISTTSFYPAKVLGAAGDAGAVFTNDANLAEKVRQLTNHGRTTHYGHGAIGWNSRMDALQAAYLNHSMEFIDARIESRRKSAAFYQQHVTALSPKIGLEIMQAPSGYDENGYCNVCFVRDPAQKQTIEANLRSNNIGFANIYPGVMSQQPGAKDHLLKHIGGDGAESICASVLNLPLFPYMTEAELMRVMDVLASTQEKV
ncbi:DegT/DnrJ/EryC1/StrS aminotransferase family protein [Thalassobius sp. Cn5-15]|uniref:DegT/DnrJ/EryC1/StrS family aminotransferase n=1 Tax=Thalassobius sp. Cn5-15 TaxID=2917763 RepID=UPI001EF1C4BE|nr:DegT/DnrJ/EryC1/StrS family aminotransferase [Thalassobius sp. Cn5-15]MCG7495019.1 DegT/DnrJ/EryC1/StrS family aminotransferase [Thalassobius sp. Cn5-15]